MDIKRMTKPEIEAKMNQFQERSSSLKEILTDINNTEVKKALQVQITNYRKSIDMLLRELILRDT